jgi:hypothetical protein
MITASSLILSSPKKGTTVVLETNGVSNGSQTTLNLAAGTDIALKDNGSGTVTVSAFGGFSSLFTKQSFNSSGRVAGTIYQNTSTQSLIVSVSMSGTTLLTAVCDANSNPTTVIAEQSQGISGGGNVPLMFVVPPSFYYKVSGTSAATSFWTEWTIVTGTVTASGDLEASKALATAYQNTGGFAKMVIVNISGLATSTLVSAVSDSSATPTAVVYSWETNASTAQATVFFIVPNGHYYKVTTGSGGTIAHWNEYTLPFNATKSNDLSLTNPQRGLAQSSVLDSRTINTFISPSWFNNQGADVFVSICQHCSVNCTIGGYVFPNSCPLFLAAGQWACAQTGGLTANPFAGLVQPGEFYLIGLDNSTTASLDHWWEYQLH